MPKKITKYDFKPGGGQGFEILSMIQYFAKFEKKLTASHRADYFQILWFKKGLTTYFVDFNAIDVRPNTVIFVNKNSVQQFNAKAIVEGTVILFTDQFFCKGKSHLRYLKGTVLFNDLFATQKVDISNISTLFKELIKLLEIELFNFKDQYQTDILRGYLYNLLLLSERELRKQDLITVKTGNNSQYVTLFKELLEEHFNIQKSVASYASKMNISSKILNVATSQIVGSSPKKMIIERIILEAKRLLFQTNHSTKEISFLLGFEEPTNFNKFFKKHTYITPIKFREGLFK